MQNKQKEICMISPTGSGKTTAIFKHFISDENNKTILAVPYLSNSKQLDKKYRDFDNIVALYEGSGVSQTKLNKAKFIVTTYDQLERLTGREDISEFNLYVDETHNVVLQQSFRTKALSSIEKLSKLVNRTVYVTATYYNLNYKGLPIIKLEQENKRFTYGDIQICPSNTSLKQLEEAVIYYYEKHKNAGKMQIIFNNHKEQNRVLMKNFERLGLRCGLLDSESRTSDAYDLVMEEERLPEGLDVCLCTTAIADGVNIENENIGNLHIHRIGNVNTFLQFIARFRNGCEDILMYVDEKEPDIQYISKDDYERDLRNQLLDVLEVLNSENSKYSTEEINGFVIDIFKDIGDNDEFREGLEEMNITKIRSYHLKTLANSIKPLYPKAYELCEKIANINDIVALKTTYLHNEQLLIYREDVKKYEINEIAVMKKYADYINRQIMFSKTALHMLIDRCEDLETGAGIALRKEYSIDEKRIFTDRVNNKDEIYSLLKRANKKNESALYKIAYEDNRCARELIVTNELSYDSKELVDKQNVVKKYVTILSAENEGILNPEKRSEIFKKGNRGWHKVKQNIQIIKNIKVFDQLSKKIRNIHNVCKKNPDTYNNYITYEIYKNIVENKDSKKVMFKEIADRLNKLYNLENKIPFEKIKNLAKQFGNVAKWDDDKGVGYFKYLDKELFDGIEKKIPIKVLEKYNTYDAIINETLSAFGGRAKKTQIVNYIKENYKAIGRMDVDSIYTTLNSGIYYEPLVGVVEIPLTAVQSE